MTSHALAAVTTTDTTPPAWRMRASSDRKWAPTADRQPLLASTARRYLQQISISLSTSSADVADKALRGFCLFLAEQHPDVTGFAQVNRTIIEDFKQWLTARPGAKLHTRATANTVRQRLGTIRTFFDRIIEWDWDDAPARTPIFSIDLPIVDDPLPKFLDDAQAAALLRTASSDPDPLRRLVIHLLLRTGMRAGELCNLQTGAVVTMRDGHWLRIPLGKLHNDRYIPLHPHLVELLAAWTASHDDHGTGRLITRHGTRLNLGHIARIVAAVAANAELGHVHPHQLRHTFATQAVNRGMRIEAIGAMLGHRTLRMTLIYARIANRTVADEYRAVSDRVDALYAEPDLPGSNPDPRSKAFRPARTGGSGDHREVPFSMELRSSWSDAYRALVAEPTDERWGWRQRVRDPRFPAVLALLVASAVLASAAIGFDAGAAVLVVIGGCALALFALPRWRDAQHGPAAGAAVLAAGAVLLLALAWLLR